jgi:uncharacterized membrane protein
MAEEIENEIHLTKGRLEGLSDGIFAFAMTLLVISLIPSDMSATTAFGPDVIQSLFSAFFRWILGFVILGAFWLDHHIQYNPLQKVDRVFIWTNLILLMFVTLVPFSLSFSAHYSQPMLGREIFYGNIFAIGLCMSVQWWYATAGHRLVKPTLKRSYIQKITYTIAIIPVLSFIAFMVGLTGVWWAGVFFLPLPFLKLGVARMSTGWKDPEP